MTEYTLTEAMAIRLQRAMLWVERQQMQGAAGTVEIEKEVPNTQDILVDDPLDDYVDGSYTYVSGQVSQFNSDSGTSTELGECWLVEVNGRTLVAGEYYMAIQSGRRNPASAGERHVFVTGQPCCP